ncbi:MAG TPA: hypothetical protein VHP34_06995 [Alphaproteobacteria bacterium]|jgi:hypothetical protein|nr:hypothetical protein [Alphaproteobacteria bacterium]
MFLLKYVVPLAAIVFFAVPAAASAWMECKGTGEVVESKQQEDGTYALQVRVVEAVVTDGMGSIGARCVSGVFPVIVAVAADEDLKIGTTVPLKFISYSAMGPEGPVSSNTWSLDNGDKE